MRPAVLLLLALAAPSLAQAPAATPAPAGAIVKSPQFTALKGQSAERQQLDDAQCQNQATQATGFVLGSTPPTSTVQTGPTGNRVRGAALGAATGAIVGSPGSGAAGGAVAGGSANRAQRRQAAAADQQAQAQWEQQRNAWGQQYIACMQQRGYSVP